MLSALPLGQVTDCVGSCAGRSKTSRWREVITHYSLALVRLCLEQQFSSGMPTQSKKDVEESGEGPAAGYRGREHVSSEERLLELSIHSLAWRRLRQGLIVAYNYIKGNCKDNKAIFFPGSRRWSIKGSNYN